MLRRVVLLALTAVSPLLSFFIWITHALPTDGAAVVIDAVLYDGQLSQEKDEAVRLMNVTDAPIDIGEWKITDDEATAVLPPNVILNAGETIWLARYGDGFQRSFGFAPDFELNDTDATIPNLSGSWTGWNNKDGDQILLKDSSDVLIDCIAYVGNYDGECGAEWVGELVQPYRGGSLFGAEGQILYRKRDQIANWPVLDTNTAADWAQNPIDSINGRKVQYAGWDVDPFFTTAKMTETAVITIAIAPDNAYAAIVNQINSAQSSIRAESLTFENVAIGEALIAAVNRGVAVTVLLEGSPAGGLPDQEKYICQQLEAAGGQCWFMISDDGNDIADRYRFLHAKFMIIDAHQVIISSENLSPNSLPSDDKSDGTWGRRGVVLITDAAGVVTHVQQVFDLDFDVANHEDIFRWQAGHEKYGEPPFGFVPLLETGGITYTIHYPQPSSFTGEFGFEMVQSPENSLRTEDSLLGLLNKAGAGDTVLVQQLSERPFWGASSSNPIDDPNPRLEAYIDAARRGATVRLMLDALFDDGGGTSNSATCSYVRETARNEGLSLECITANPAGLGIHNKMVLVEVNGRGTIHIGSLNGSEQSSKGNRELAIQVQSDGAYGLLAQMFEQDWPKNIYLPIILNDYAGPAPHLLISEVLYDPFGQDDAEFIEIVNPTGTTIDLSNYALGDAVNQSDFEDVRRFPSGTTIAPNGTIVVATTATGFNSQHGFNPDFEIVETNTAVSNLIDDPNWGDPAALLQLANGGDEVILRNAADQVVDVITYGSGSYPGIVGCALVTASNYSLERYPYWRDTDNCSDDFRDWPFPNPNSLP